MDLQCLICMCHRAEGVKGYRSAYNQVLSITGLDLADNSIISMIFSSF